MAKKKAPSKPFHLFFLGLVIGAALARLPFNQEFTPVRFTPKEHTAPLFADSFPLTSPVIQRDGYTLAYNGQTRNAHWVYHKLTQESLAHRHSRAECEFKEDPDLPEQIRAAKIDYQQSGFDRGHLCPAADCPTKSALENSFFLSNISPQDPAFNRGYWKMLEQHARELTKHYKTVHTFSGPLYLSNKGRDGKNYVKYEVIGLHNVAVPTHFFMLLFVENPSGKLLTKGFILPNKPIETKTPLKKYAATLEEIEKASGILFSQLTTSHLQIN